MNYLPLGTAVKAGLKMCGAQVAVAEHAIAKVADSCAAAALNITSPERHVRETRRVPRNERGVYSVKGQQSWAGDLMGSSWGKM